MESSKMKRSHNKLLRAVIVGVAGLAAGLLSMGMVIPANAAGGSASDPIATGGGFQGRAIWRFNDADAGQMKAYQLEQQNPGNEARSKYGDIFSGWGKLGPRTRGSRGKVVDQAVQDCKNRNHGKCTNARVVAMGIAQAKTASQYQGDGWSTPAMAGWMPAVVTDGYPVVTPKGNYTWNAKGHSINLDTKVANGSSIRGLINDALRGGQKGIVAVVLADEDVQVSGWKPKWADVKSYDIKATSSSTTPYTQPITGIAEYQVTATGYDGYVKGMSTKPQSYQTPFGSLLKAVNTCQNTWKWDGGNGTDVKEFTGLCSKTVLESMKDDPSGAVAKANANIKTAAEWARDQSEKMEVNFDIKNADGVEGQTGKDLTEAFKKGGQYKITKSRRWQSISFEQKGMNVQYHRRPVDGFYFNGWAKCKKGDAGCGYFGKDGNYMNGQRPGTRKVGNKTYNLAWMTGPWAGKWGVVTNRAAWSTTDRAFAMNAIHHNAQWEGRKFWTAQAARENGEGNMTLCRMENGKAHWLQPQFESEFWAGSNASDWMDTSHFKPAPDNMQSPVVIAMQDFVHLNCNKEDFDAYVAMLSGRKTPTGEPLIDPASIQSTKYTGSFNTNIIKANNPVDVKQPLTGMTKTLQQGGHNVLTSNDKLTNGDPATLDNFLIQWSSHTFMKGPDGKTSGDIDPVYTKECPYDCAADTVTSNVRKTGANPDDVASNSYGIKVWNNTDGKDIDTSNTPFTANTADMQFFRNNEWNYFTLDKWVPVTGNGITYNNGPAVSTTIVKDPNGTPWAKDGNQLTEMQGKTGENWTGLFGSSTAIDQGKVLNQWSHSITDQFNAGGSQQLAGQVTEFRIKSPWATENGRPLKFNVKWEYETDNTVKVPSKITFKNGSGTAQSSIVNMVDSSTKVDGKCDSQFHNNGQAYLDHTGDSYAWSGVTRKNQPDMQYEQGNALKGWFTITFVRATAE